MKYRIELVVDFQSEFSDASEAEMQELIYDHIVRLPLLAHLTEAVRLCAEAVIGCPEEGSTEELKMNKIEYEYNQRWVRILKGMQSQVNLVPE